ncbi:MAG: DEAD/DEAH box helicase, partial [Myxococcales bacterium]
IDSQDGLRDFRDPAAESALLAGLDIGDAVGLVGGRPRAHEELSGQALLDFVEQGHAVLLACEEIDVVEDGQPLDYRQASGDPEISFDLVEAIDGDNDWLDLSVIITVDGESVPVGTVLAALTRREKFIFTESGLLLRTDHPAFAGLAELVEAAGQIVEQPEGGLRVARTDLSLWDELAALGVVDAQAEQWVRSAVALRTLETLPEVHVSGLKSELRAYQDEGVRWLTFLRRAGLGGILADDMGLGKTLQALAVIANAREEGAAPFLVIAPTSVVGAWAEQAAAHTPGLDVSMVTSSSRKREKSIAALFEESDIVVTSYTLFRLEDAAYREQQWGGLVLDEAHTIKNHQGKTYQAVRRLDVPFRMALTGTPFENRLMELWALLSVVAPGLYPWPTKFAEAVSIPVERHGNQAALDRFRRRIRPFLLRRTKDLVAADLPPKQEQVVTVQLGARHRRIYDTHLQRERQTVLGLIEDFDHQRIAIFRALTRLRQLSLDPGLVDEEYAAIGSAKLEILVDQLHELASEGHRALVFSQFTSYLTRVRARLEAEGIAYEYLDGSTSNRPAVIDRFKSGDAPVFLISLKAGGVGLTLTEADYVFVLDPWWNPAAEAQAVDRAHRIGQDRPVLVYRLVAEGTIEEKVMELKARKQALFSQVIDGDAMMSTGITAEDVRGLFGE